MSLYLPNRAKYGVASAPGTSTSITLGTLVPGFIPLKSSGFPAAGLPVVYYAEDTIGGVAVVEIGDATLNYSAGTWSLTNRNPYEQSDGSTTLLSLTSAALIGFSLRAGDFFGFYGGDVNKFRNGLFDIWQRGTSITVSTSGAYTADGWIVTSTGASVTVTQDSTRGNSDNLLALKIAGAASVTDVKLIQRIESYIAAPLANQTCTVRFKVYNGKASGSLTPTLKLDHASAVDNFGSVGNDLAATNLQSCANGAWTDVAYSFVAGANVINGMQVTLDFGALGSGDYVEVTAADIRLTPFVATGLCATPPLTERRPIHRELEFCQRYYRTNYDLGVAPGTSQTGTSAGLMGGVLVSGSGSTYNAISIPLGGRMRADPSISYWDRAGNASKVSQYQGGSWFDNVSALTTLSTSQVGWLVYVTIASLLVYFAASAEL